MKIIIDISDKEKAKNIINLLKDIPYVKNIFLEEDIKVERKPDFYSVFGIWRDRDISLEDIRKKAWGNEKL